MSDQPDQPDQLPDDEDARIRALLADAGGPEPVPDDVARRLDDVLAALVAERGTAPTPATAGGSPGDDLAARRARGRRTRWLLAAAAVVVVAGIGVPVAREVTGGSGTTTSASDAGSSNQDGAVPPPAAPSASAPSLGRSAPALSRATFRRDVVALLDRLGQLPSGAASPVPDAAGCTGGPTPRGVVLRLPVRLDGTPAVLDVGAPDAGARVVRAVACSGTPVLASTRLPD